MLPFLSRLSKCCFWRNSKSCFRVIMSIANFGESVFLSLPPPPLPSVQQIATYMRLMNIIPKNLAADLLNKVTRQLSVKFDILCYSYSNWRYRRHAGSSVILPATGGATYTAWHSPSVRSNIGTGGNKMAADDFYSAASATANSFQRSERLRI